MEHLTTEALARLVDEAASEAERDHLDGCEACSTGLEEVRSQTVELAALPDLRPPRGVWDHLEARLVSEGLIRGESRLAHMGRTPGWMRTAAAAVLFLGGAGLGMAFAGGPGDTRDTAALDDASSPFSLASDVSSLDEAAAVVQLAERQYMDALIRYRQLLDAANGDTTDPEVRYAALEYTVAALQSAMRAAPADPFLNGLLASTLAERNAAGQQTVRRASQGLDWY